ncbi:MAG: YkgJ family cysteine cluster protein, partial [Proteobacteria bacterium]|nr:YkgJ family cysteine cluster protein [Pseudomonadota bacterium]
ALYINHQFNKKFKDQERQKIIDKANRADRKVYQIKRKAYKDMQSGKNEVDILMEIGAERCRCPLLNDKDMCDLYESRPVTCRLYGIPTSIGGISHTCGKSGFLEGKPYPSVNLDTVQQRLFQISQQLIAEIKSKYLKMGEMLVPLSMALLTVYDAEYLGMKSEQSASEKQGKGDD